MNHQSSMTEKEVVSLLTQLKAAGGGYPPEFHAARRSKVLEQAAGLNIGASVMSGKALTNLQAGLHATTQVVMQSVLGVIMAGVMITAGIFFRQEIVDFFTPDDGGPVPTEIAFIPAAATPTPVAYSTPTRLAETTPTLAPKSYRHGKSTAVAFVTLDQTPKPPGTWKPPGRVIRKTPTPTATATPTVTPSLVPTRTHPGLHLGQTPTPPAFRRTPKP